LSAEITKPKRKSHWTTAAVEAGVGRQQSAIRSAAALRKDRLGAMFYIRFTTTPGRTGVAGRPGSQTAQPANGRRVDNVRGTDSTVGSWRSETDAVFMQPDTIKRHCDKNVSCGQNADALQQFWPDQGRIKGARGVLPPMAA